MRISCAQPARHSHSVAVWLFVLLVVLAAVAGLRLTPATAQRAGEARGDDPPADVTSRQREQRAADGESELRLERYLIAREQIRQMPTAPELAWAELGPGNIGGRTRQLVAHPADPQTLYAVSQAGGIWKTTNGGNDWQPLSDLFVTLTVGALAIDPANPDTLYAGTGIGAAERFAAAGIGLFKSADGGATWTHLTATNRPEFRFVNDIVVSPRNGQRLYAATNTGVWRSLDGGASWSLTRDGREFGGAIDLAIRTDQPTDVVFAAFGPTQGRLFRNADAGGAGEWVSVYNRNLSPIRTARLAIAPSNQNIVYFWLGGLGLLRTTTGGADDNAWNDVAPDDPFGLLGTLLTDPLAYFQHTCNLGPRTTGLPQTPRPVGALAIDPTDPNRIWLGGVAFLRSDDAGRSWGLASYSQTNPGAPQALPAHQYAIAFPANYDGVASKRMYVANDGGVFRTEDARAPVGLGVSAACTPDSSRLAWQASNRGYRATAFLSGAVSPDGRTCFGGTLGTGLLRGTVAAGRDGWTQRLPGDVGPIAIDPVNPTILYASTTNFIDTTNSIYPFPTYAIRKSTNGGESFTTPRSGIFEASNLPNVLAGLAIDPSNPQRLWSGATSLFRSENAGAGWTPIFFLGSNGIFNTTLSAIGIAPTDSRSVLAGTGIGAVGRLENALSDRVGISISVTTPRQGYVSAIVFDPADEKIAYATYATFGGVHVWKTRDGGTTWASADGAGTTGLPDVPVNAIAIDPFDSMRIFLGTDLGLFVSPDGGGSWAAETGLPRVPVAALAFNVTAEGNALFAFTHGRGVWRAATGLQSCRYRLSAANAGFDAAGGAGSVTVTAQPAACAWTARSNVAWLSIDSTAEGVVRFTVAANASIQSRTGTLAAAGRSVVVTQRGAIDATPPTVTILTPQNNPTTTPLDTVTLSGAATDSNGIAQLSLLIDGGPPAPGIVRINGTTQWSIPSIPLHPGANLLTVRATDASGNIGTASITIESRPERLAIPTASVAEGFNHLLFDPAGRLLFTTSNGVRRLLPDGKSEIVAGGGEPGFGGDGGPATGARFSFPQGLALDRNGNLFIADRGNHRIRKVSPDGLVATIAGSDATGGFGGDGGSATAARLNAPTSLAIGPGGDLFIADTLNHRIRKIDAGGVITTFAGTGTSGETGDGGPAINAQLGAPSDLLFDPAGNLLMTTGSRVRRITPQGLISTLAGGGTGYGAEGATATTVALFNPTGLAFDPAGILHIAERDTRAIRGIFPNGTIRTLARGISPSDLASDAGGAIFAAEGLRLLRLRPFPASDTQPPIVTILAPTSEQTYTTTVAAPQIRGRAKDDTLVVRFRVTVESGAAAFGNARQPESVAYAAQFEQGLLEWQAAPVLKPGVNRLTFTAWDVFGNSGSAELAVVFRPFSLVETIAGATGEPGDRDAASAREARFNSPQNLAFDAAGNLFVSDTGNHRIRRITPAGTVSVVAGSGAVGDGGDGGPATAAELNQPRGLVIDAAGNLYFADSLNHRIRKITPAGVISTVAGTGQGGFRGDGGPAIEAQLNLPLDVALDGAGGLCIADANNRRIRKVTLNDGRISTLVSPNYPATQGGVAPGLNFPVSLAFTPAGLLLIADRDAGRIHQLSPTGTLTTAVGNPEASLNEEGLPAANVRIGSPVAVAATPAGEILFIADSLPSIGRVAVDGLLFQLIQNGILEGDSGSLLRGADLAVDARGRIVYADSANHRIVAVTPADFAAAAAVSAASFTVGRGLSAGSIVSLFGAKLSTSTELATTLPLPFTLAGTRVAVWRSNTESPAQLFFTSPGQINLLMPDLSPPEGLLRLVAVSSAGDVHIAPVRSDTYAPAIFSANANGQGVAAAIVLRVRADGSQSFEPVAVFDSAQNRFVPRPIDVSPPGEDVYLILFGTGFRKVEYLREAVVRIGGLPIEPLYAGAQGSLAGLDQINLPLPRSLAGRGEVEITVSIVGRPANPVRIQIR